MLTNDKKPNKTNWFSSLRRQKKPKNSSKLQQSCLDLSSSVWIEDNMKTKSSKSLTSDVSLRANSNSSISATSTASLASDTGKILCENCCRLRKSGIIISDDMRSYGPQSRLSNIHSTFENLLISNDTPIQSNIISTDDVNQTIQYVNKKEHINTNNQQTTLRTTTIITRTTIIKKPFHRSGLIFGDDGEILNNLETTGRQFLLNQLHNKSLSLNGSNNNLKQYGSQKSNDSSANSIILNLENNNDIGFIDDDNVSIYDDVYTPPPRLCSNCKCDVKSPPELSMNSGKVNNKVLIIIYSL